MKTLTLAIATFVACAANAGTGCGDKDKAVTTAATKPAAVVSPGKRIAAIDVQHRLSAKPSLGEPLELALELDSRVASSFDVAYTLPEGLSGDGRPRSKVVGAGEAMTIEFVPLVEGRHYVTVVATPIDSAGAPRVVSIPVQVGTGAALKAAAAERTADGELLIRMKAD